MANSKYIPRMLQPPKGSYFLLGPRGTGKSTWLLHHYPQAMRIDLLLGEEERRFSAYPERIREVSAALPEGSTLILDEIQRVPKLLPEIHALIEEKRDIQYVMTGSSSRKLRRSVSDLLGGRALLRQMGPFLASELKEQFSLEKALKTGLIPLIWESSEPEDRLRDYLYLYLREEVQAESLVRQIGDFSRFLEVASFSHASIWTTTDISRESSVKRATVDNYLQILEDLLLAFTLPVFTRRAKRKLISHSKFYFFDAGIYRILRPHGILDSSQEIEGMALEGLVAQHLRSWVLAQHQPHTFSFWRTQTGLEVDFVIYGPRGFWAIEVKRSPNLGPDDVRALSAFKEEYPEALCAIVTLGKRKENYRGFDMLPMEEFLLSITPENPILT
ncbi:MAG: ATP-binding protein [Verrucomicrobia bacterium]|nr:ATP-binding protein [Verrucomicrobiota bacterium]